MDTLARGEEGGSAKPGYPKQFEGIEPLGNGKLLKSLLHASHGREKRAVERARGDVVRVQLQGSLEMDLRVLILLPVQEYFCHMRMGPAVGVV